MCGEWSWRSGTSKRWSRSATASDLLCCCPKAATSACRTTSMLSTMRPSDATTARMRLCVPRNRASAVACFLMVQVLGKRSTSPPSGGGRGGRERDVHRRGRRLRGRPATAGSAVESRSRGCRKVAEPPLPWSHGASLEPLGTRGHQTTGVGRHPAAALVQESLPHCCHSRVRVWLPVLQRARRPLPAAAARTGAPRERLDA